ncbi:uncharacterized protein [Amphiura filiformis]|uniref:uncharacterized protein n=1 Tax=Amphiura filiformis TaxID=82378 RepID=UPI003B221AE6
MRKARRDSSSSSSSDDDSKKKGGLPKVSRSELKKFQKECLEHHNDYRKKHKVSAMKMSDDLCKSAQEWAQELAKKNQFKTSGRTDVGENVGMHYSSASTEYSGKECAETWYTGMREYNFKKPEFGQKTAYFTQMVWKNTKEFGIGKAITKENKVIVVAQYNPPGNFQGQFDRNVFPRDDGYRPPSPAVKAKIHKSDDIKKGAKRDSSSSSDDEKKKKGGLFKKKDKKADTPAPTVSKSELKKFQKETLEHHNNYRKKHKSPALKMSDELCKSAQDWAEQLASKDQPLKTSGTYGVGENIAMHYSSATTEYSGKQATDQWYIEGASKYDYKKAAFSQDSGHFTQLVWKGSKEFGVGKAITKENKVILVAQYKPPGNMRGDYADNVFPRSGRDRSPSPKTKKASKGGGARRDSSSSSSSSSDDDRKTTHKIKTEKKIQVTVKKVEALKLDEPDVSPKDLREFRRDLLKAQNKIREKHNAEPLKRSKDLQERAQDWAAHLAKKGEFKNSDNSDVGENIAMHYNSASFDFSGEQAAELWYKQREKYDFKKPGFTNGAGQFTQMVWKGSKEFGAGKAITKEGKVIVVGFYKPPGNYKKEFEDNVDKPRK